MTRAVFALIVSLLASPAFGVPHEATITRWAQFYGVPVWLAIRVAEVESSFDSSAISSEGSRGLFQISAKWERELVTHAGVVGFRWWHADDSARVGLAYLARLHRRYGDWVLAIAAYNCGPGRLESARALPRETVEYLRRIFG